MARTWEELRTAAANDEASRGLVAFFEETANLVGDDNLDRARFIREFADVYVFQRAIMSIAEQQTLANGVVLMKQAEPYMPRLKTIANRRRDGRERERLAAGTFTLWRALLLNGRITKEDSRNAAADAEGSDLGPNRKKKRR
jgi:hypothetical protein